MKLFILLISLLGAQVFAKSLECQTVPQDGNIGFKADIAHKNNKVSYLNTVYFPIGEGHLTHGLSLQKSRETTGEYSIGYLDTECLVNLPGNEGGIKVKTFTSTLRCDSKNSGMLEPMDLNCSIK